MKKLLLIASLVFSFVTGTKAQILNGGFETWTAGLPDNWWGVPMPPMNIFSQSSTAHSGSFAVNLHVDALSGQNISSPLSTGDGMNTQTHPLAWAPMSLTFWYQLNAAGGDMVTVTALVYDNGQGVGVIASSYPASASYTSVSANFMYGGPPPASPDSIAIIFQITNSSGTPTLGTDLLIDDVSISQTAGITDVNASPAFYIYPNPADKSLTLGLPSGEFSDISVADVTGRIVYSDSHSYVGEMKLDTEHFQAGQYFCTVKSGDGIYRKTFVVKH